jgi:GNAT superfamily N-acetyltransferase
LGGYLHHDGAEGEPELHPLYVDPQRKRGGIGSALMQALHELLRLGASYFLFVHAATDVMVRPPSPDAVEDHPTGEGMAHAVEGHAVNGGKLGGRVGAACHGVAVLECVAGQ